MSKIYISLLIKKITLGMMKLLFSKSSIINQAHESVQMALTTHKEIKKFKDLSIKNYQDLFYHFSPIPGENEIKNFYKNLYSISRKNTEFKISDREFSQILFLKKKYNFQNKKILNFGSGKSGFSYLCKLMGATVTEVDLKNKEDTYFDKDIFFTNDLTILSDKKFDLIYASHSLEHTTKLKETLEVFSKLSHTDTHYFIEVPEGNHDLQNIKRRARKIDHIFYFQKKFFEKIFDNQNKTDSFLNLFDNENLKNFSERHDKNNLILWTNKKLNLEFIKNLNYK